MNISIKQGLDFNKYQEKIIKQTIQKSKRNAKTKAKSCSNPSCHCIHCTCGDNCKCGKKSREGFVSSAPDDLVQQYDQAMSQYKDAVKQVSSEVTNNIYREGPNNPYSGKNWLLNGTGAIGYVTDQGVYKWYPSWDVMNNTSGKNGCPTGYDQLTNNSPNYNLPGQMLGTQPDLEVGNMMVSGQSCGNEGNNVYVSSLVNNPNNEYKGCYPLYPPSPAMELMPLFTSSAATNGYSADASSIWGNDIEGEGPWRVFDQNNDTFWHSSTDPSYLYDATTGVYQGTSSVTYSPDGSDTNTALVSGESIYALMPPTQSTYLQYYTLSPRRDNHLWSDRSPNSWILLGRLKTDANETRWYVVDTQSGQSFNSADDTPTYYVNSTTPYNQYALVVTKVGNDSPPYDMENDRYCLQISGWNLYGTAQASSSSGQSPSMDLLANGDPMTYDECSQLSTQLGYNYFGMGNTDNSGNSQCYGSNDFDKVTMNGDSSVTYEIVPIWSTNTTNVGNSAAMWGDGRFIVFDSVWNIAYQAGGTQPCWWGGTPNPDSVTASFGGNCVGKPKGIDCGNPSSTESYGSEGISGNLTSLYKDIFLQSYNDPQTFNTTYNTKDNSSFSIPALAGYNGEDPAYCCSKMVNYSYQCGGGSFKSGSVNAGEQVNFDCVQEKQSCVFYVTLQEDGNMCVYRGTPTDTKEAVYCTMTNGKQRDPNPDYVASKGKNGRSYLSTGESLQKGEWIGSNDGSLMLTMQTDGNLVLYTFNKKVGCTTDQNGKNMGTTNNVALYKVNPGSFSGNLGKVGYVDRNAVLHEYPDTMLGKSNNYTIFKDLDSAGNDLPGAPLTNISVEECQTSCNNNGDCAGFVYLKPNQLCYMKNNNMYPKGAVRYYKDLDMYVRNPIVNAPASCPTKFNAIDSVQYENYVKGDAMTSDFQCGESLVSGTSQSTLQTLQNQLSDLANQIVGGTNNNYNRNVAVNQDMANKKIIGRKDIMNYNKTQQQIRFLEEQPNNNNNVQNLAKKRREGMTNLVDVQAMEKDTSLWVSMENSDFILWTFITLGLISLTIYVAGKRKK